MLIIKLLRAPSPGGHLSKHSQCQHSLARYHKLLTQQENKFPRFNPVTCCSSQAGTETGPSATAALPGRGKHMGSFTQRVCPSQGRKHKGDTGTGTSRMLDTSRITCLVLTQIEERKKTHPISPTIFFQPYLPKEAKKIPC